MLFQVTMQIHIPHDADQEKIRNLSATEMKLAQNLQREGKWLHLWRVAGKWANVSIFDVDSNDELHEILSSLPLFPFMALEVTPLSKHPASIV
ncbi:muconolactone Delta-isomerase [Pseudomonas sp. MAG733B]|uniref:muconolactone Delta-isomerase n=1 Tax=Pseudomonas sp. MAG733B TaxID=3122079 RepID=UPI0030D5B4D3